MTKGKQPAAQAPKAESRPHPTAAAPAPSHSGPRLDPPDIEHELKALLAESSPILIWMSGLDKLCYYFNRAWLEFVGRTLEQEQGNGWAENVHPEDFDRCLATYVSAFDARRPFEMEYRLRHHTGEYRWIFDRGAPRFASDGSFQGYIGGCLDIHEQRKAREESAQARARLAAIVESSDDAIISKDLRGIVTSWNPAAEKIFGYTAAEMIGRPILTIIPPELHHDEERILSTIARGERIDHFETVRLRKDGERIDVSLTVSPVKDASGRIAGAAKIARDITERKRAETALRTSERLASVGRLAATIAHEINNPLEAVTNLVYLAKNVAVRDEVRQYLSMAEEELERVAHMTKQTLGFYRDTRGHGPVRVGALMLSLLPVFSSRLRNKAIEVRPEIRDDVEIHGVAGELRQLVANLLSNSIDAVAEHGRITLRVSAARAGRDGELPGVRLTIADNGVGISKEARSRLFEPFFTTKKDVGTGLGLWVCKSIVEKHGGSIRMRSVTSPGESGTVFSVFLPARVKTTVTETLKQAV